MGNLGMGNWAMAVLGVENLGLVGLRRPRKLPTASSIQLLRLKVLQIKARGSCLNAPNARPQPLLWAHSVKPQ